MAETKGITVQFRGDVSDFEKAVKQVNGDLKETKSEISLLNKQLKFDPKNVEALTKKFDALQQKEKQLTELTKTLQDGMKNFDPNSKEWSDYNKQLQSATLELEKLKNELSSMPSANVAVLAKDFQEWGKSLDGIGKKLENVGKKLAVLSGGIVALATGGVKFNAQLEQYQTAYSTLIGDAEKASETVSKIQEDASKSPFDTASLIEANQYLISAGVEAEESRQFINALGDAIASTGGGSAELSRMAQNLQQIKNVGKASSIDIKQFAMAGINIYGLLAETTGKTVEELNKMDITYEQLLEAFTKASSEGGRYFGAMENQSQTLNGTISTLKDSVAQLLGELTQSLMPIIKSIISFINELVNKLRNLSPEQQAMITKIGLLIASLSPLLAIGGKILQGIGGISVKIGELISNPKVISFFAKLTANGSSLGAILKTLVSTFTKLINPVTVIIGLLALLYANSETFRNAVNGLASSVWNLVKTAFTTLANILRVVFQIIGQVLNVLGRLWQSFANSTAGQQFVTFLTNVVKLITNLINWLSKLVEWLGKVFKWFGELIGIATDFNGVTGALTTKLGRNGMSLTMQSGGLMSGGMMSNITMNNTFTITNGNDIDQRVVEHWADVMTDRINYNLGRMV